jgi:hypothetical protein
MILCGIICSSRMNSQMSCGKESKLFTPRSLSSAQIYWEWNFGNAGDCQWRIWAKPFLSLVWETRENSEMNLSGNWRAFKSHGKTQRKQEPSSHFFWPSQSSFIILRVPNEIHAQGRVRRDTDVTNPRQWKAQRSDCTIQRLISVTLIKLHDKSFNRAIKSKPSKDTTQLPFPSIDQSPSLDIRYNLILIQSLIPSRKRETRLASIVKCFPMITRMCPARISVNSSWMRLF